MIKPLLQQETQLLEDNLSSPGASAPWGNWGFTRRVPFLLHPSMASCIVPTCILSIGKKKKVLNQTEGEKVLNQTEGEAKEQGMASPSALCPSLGPHALGRGRSSLWSPLLL